jgi:invasion protein IalB
MSIFLLTRRLRALATLAFLVAMTSALVPDPAAAQPKDGQVFQDWAMRCQKNPQNPAIEVCSIAHAAINAQTQKPVMQIQIGYIDQVTDPIAVITVPLRVRLPPGLRLQVDDGQPVTIPYELCNPEGCKARFQLDKTIINSFKKGSGGKIAVQVPPSQEVEIPFSLKGFTAALAALK